MYNSEKCTIQTTGTLLLDYKGLKILKFNKSELQTGEFNPTKFNLMCHIRCHVPNPLANL